MSPKKMFLLFSVSVSKYEPNMLGSGKYKPMLEGDGEHDKQRRFGNSEGARPHLGRGGRELVGG